jgi:hypothetical protein
MINICYKLFHLEPSGGSSAPKPSGVRGRNEPNPSTDKLDKPTEGGDATKKPLSSENTNDQIHISFDGLKIDHSLKILLSSYFISF